MDDFESKLVPEFSDNTDTDDEQTTVEDEVMEEDAGQEEVDESPADGADEESDTQDEPADAVVPKSQYDNLRADYTKKSMELASIKKGATQEANIATKKQPTTVQEFIQQQVEQNVQAALAPLQEQQEDLRIQAKVKALSDQYEDFDDVADAFIKVLEENEQLFELPNGLDIAYQAARSGYLEKSAEAKAIAAQQSKAATVAAKRSLVDTNSATKNQASAKTDEQKIKESIFGVTESSSTFKF